MNDLPGTLDQLSARLETLEQRVHLLEHPSAASTTAAATEAGALPAPQAGEELSFAQVGGLFPVLGKAMLGIAGAYLLRAVAEATTLPKLAVAAIAIAYTLLWLVWATRVAAKAWMAGTVYASTSAVILAPMLWELTLSFKVLPPAATAAILAAFVFAASVLSWKRDLASVIWVTNGAAAVAALALGIATHQLVPFIAALLLMVLFCEAAAELNHELSVRPFVAAATDLAILALVFIYSGPPGARGDYPALSPAFLLAPGCLISLLYAASIVARTTVLGQNITAFEIIQAMIAFLLAASSVLYFTPESGAIVLGAVCLLLAVACYALVFGAFRVVGADRNYQVFAAWGTTLLFAGSLLCLPPFWMSMCLGLAAIAATLLGIHLHLLALQVHGKLLLLAGAAASGLIGYAFHSLAGALPNRLAPGVCVASASALVCYAATKPGSGDSWLRQFLELIPAALTACAVAALLVQSLLFVAALRLAPDDYHVAFIRTLATCIVALSAAFSGSRWQRVELTRIAYAAMAFVAAKLVFEDMRHAHLEFIAASIFLFAITLIAIPRLARRRQKV